MVVKKQRVVAEEPGVVAEEPGVANELDEGGCEGAGVVASH